MRSIGFRAGRSLILASAFLTLASASSVGRAEEDSSNEATRQFELGVKSSQRESYDRAAEHFQRAYEISQDYRYLYNLGLTYVWRWKPVEAVSALELYLSKGGERIAQRRRVAVEAELVRQRARIAWVVLDVAPPGAEVRIDGKLVGKSPFRDPVPTSGGAHVLTATLAGHRSEERELRLPVAEQTPVQIALTAAPPAPPELGRLVIDCPVPSVRVLVEGRDVGLTPVAPVAVAEGAHSVEFERVGYATRRARAEVHAHTATHVSCALSPATPAVPGLSGRIELAASEPGATLLSDGRPLESGASLPIGPHVLEVGRYGFETWRGIVQIRARRTERVEVVLKPTPAYLKDYRERALTRRRWSYGVGALGVLALGTSAGLAIWNEGRYSEWQRERDALESGSSGAGFETRRTQANDLWQSVTAVDKAVLVTGVVGGVLLLGAAILHWGGDDPERYAERRGSPAEELGSAEDRAR